MRRSCMPGCCTSFFHPHLNRSLLLDSCDWQAWLAWGCEMLVSMLFTLPAWQSFTSLQMFPESCKYLLCALMSADSLSDRKDIPVFLSVSMLLAAKQSFPCEGTFFRWSEGINENITQGASNNNFWRLIQIFSAPSYYTAGLDVAGVASCCCFKKQTLYKVCHFHSDPVRIYFGT